MVYLGRAIPKGQRWAGTLPKGLPDGRIIFVKNTGTLGTGWRPGIYRVPLVSYQPVLGISVDFLIRSVGNVPADLYQRLLR